MSIEENKRTVKKFVESVNGGAPEAAFDMMTDDAIWWIPTDKWGGQTFTKQQMQGAIGAFMNLFVEPPVFDYGRMTAEGDRVCLEMNCKGGKTKGGNVYANNYNMFFQLKGGKICEVREFMNPILAGPVAAEAAG